METPQNCRFHCYKLFNTKCYKKIQSNYFRFGKLHHEFGSKCLIEILNGYGLVEMIYQFKPFQTAYCGKVSVWCDNYDLNNFTPNGTLVMGTEFVQLKHLLEESTTNFTVARLTLIK